MFAIARKVLWLSLVTLLPLAPALAICEGSGLEVGSILICENGRIGIVSGSGPFRSYERNDGAFALLQGSGSSRFFSDSQGLSGSILGRGGTRLVFTDDGPWGTVTRYGNSDHVLLPGPEFDDPWLQ